MMRDALDRFFASTLAVWLAMPLGAAVALAFAPFDFWPIAYAAMAFLFLAWADASPRRAAKIGFLFTAGTYLAGTYWLYHSIYEIGKAPLPLTLFVMFALVAIMGAYTAGLGYLVARWLVPRAATSPAGQHANDARTVLSLLFAMPAAWVLLEWFRGWFLSGFPWLALGYTHLDTPVSALAPVGGIYTLSFAVAVCAGALAVIVRCRGRTRVWGIVALAVVWLAGLLLSLPQWTEPNGRTLSVAVVQGAVRQDLKWSPEQRDATIELYTTLTEPHLGADLIVWPEAALPALAHELVPVLEREWSKASERGSALVIGQLRYDFESNTYYNAVLALADEPQWYAKRRLVPFSEFFPVPDWVKEWLRGMKLPYSGFAAGEPDQPPLDAAGEKLGVTICYEDAYASDQLAVLREATLLVNVTNDAWFGDSTAAHQHLQISRMRALEAGRPLIRAANDGISAVIGADGRISHSLPRFQPGVLTATVEPHRGLTPYARVGNVPIVMLCALLVGATAWQSRRRARASSEQDQAIEV